MGPELVLVGWVASPIIGWVVNLAMSQFLEEGTKSMLNSLKKNLVKVATVAELDTTGIKSKNLKEWISSFRDALYDAEDAIDGFAYRFLQAKAKAKQLAAGGRKKKRAWEEPLHRIMQRRDLFKETRNCFKHWKDTKKLKKVTKTFEKLSQGISTLLSAVQQQERDRKLMEEEGIPDWRVTTSGATSVRIPDYAPARTHLPALTADESAPGNKNFSVVPIVGTGGVGKTELARLAYNIAKEHSSKKDNAGKQEGRFEKMAWVYVFKNFNVKRIRVEIIENVAEERPHDLHSLRNQEVIRTILTDELKDKKFLIVLDDVWDVSDDLWQQICTAFNSGKPGSKIVVTTRLEKTANMVGTEDPIKLDGLEDEDEYWELFKEYAFADREPVDLTSLESIGKQIAKKFGGSPLAASKVGSQLKSNLEELHWRRILDKKLGVIERKEDDIVSVLALSYQHLPEQLQRCYLSCALFPKNYCFVKEQLLQIWMALGFIHSDDKGAVDDLASGSFFVNSKRSREGRQGFAFHAVLHELAELICDGEFFRLADYQQLEIPPKARHLYVSADNLVRISEKLSKEEKKRLRSLVIGGTLSSEPGTAFMKSLKEVLKGAKRLRLLMLSELPGELPEEISHLKHLRYLEFPCRELKKLPQSFGMLYHLQCVYLNNGENSELLTFCKEMTQLEKMRLIEEKILAVSIPSTPPHEEAAYSVLIPQRRTRRRLFREGS